MFCSCFIERGVPARPFRPFSRRLQYPHHVCRSKAIYGHYARLESCCPDGQKLRKSRLILSRIIFYSFIFRPGIFILFYLRTKVLFPSMGLTLSKSFRRIFAKKRMRILMLGLDAAGKTTILYQLKLGEVVSTIPTIGFNVESVHFKNVVFTVWDMGGQDRIRGLWRHYFRTAQGLVFVVDSSDRHRLAEVKHELFDMLDEVELRNAKLLILANKMDMPNAISATDMVDALGLNQLCNRRWHVQSTCATNGNGLAEGLEWLSDELFK